jgi:hypothetical protein
MTGKFPKAAIAVAFIIFILMPACKKEQRCSVHPEAFRFSLKDSSTDSDLLISGAYKAEDIGIFYIYNGERQDLIVHEEQDHEAEYIIMTSAQLPMISLTGRSDKFYLVLSPEVTDTLVVVVEKEDRGDCDYHPYKTVKHNGRELTIIEGKSFILEK